MPLQGPLSVHSKNCKLFHPPPTKPWQPNGGNMNRSIIIAVISGVLFSTGCETDLVSDDEEQSPAYQTQQLSEDDDITGQLSPWNLIENPVYTPVHEIDYINDHEQVFISKACGVVLVYPHRKMIVEVVNEEAHGVLMAVTYCPITRSGIAWNRVLGSDTLLLTASGYLFRENLMPLDLNSGSIWAQMRLQGMSGKHNFLTVETLPLIETTWETVRDYFPEAGVFTNKSLLKSSKESDVSQSGGIPIGQEFGILSWDAVELFTLDMFPGEISLQFTTVSPGGRVVVAGSTNNSYMVAFKTTYELEAVEGEFPIIMKDETGTYWTVFGEAVNGERGGEKLKSPVFYTAADWAWKKHFDNISRFYQFTE